MRSTCSGVTGRTSRSPRCEGLRTAAHSASFAGSVVLWLSRQGRVEGGSVRGRVRRLLASGVLAVVALGLASTGSAAAHPSGEFTPGAAGIGDSYFPLYGNGGYDVQEYRVSIRYDPSGDSLAGFARITAVATQDLSRFNLDFVGLTIRSLKVNGRRADYARELDHELVVTPRRGLKEGRRFKVSVSYDGVPAQFVVPCCGIPTGVVPTDDGAVFWGEPEVAAAWFPVNDHPRDKAAYRIDVTVPAGLEAISNGNLKAKIRAPRGWTTWKWRENEPMASYLTVVAIGQFDIRRGETSDGIPILDAVDPRVGDAADRALSMQEEIVDFLAGFFGPYPFEALGGIVDFHRLGAALETQTRPIYDWRFFGGEGDEGIIVHELAHQWYGDDVAVDEWKHIWLNEGFATYAEWLWSGAQGGDAPQEIFDAVCSRADDDPLWEGEVGDPGVAHLFDELVYTRGAMALQALRNAVGESDFFSILRAWAARRGGGTGTTAQFQALAEQISGEELDGLFTEYLFTPGKPADCGASAAVSERRAAHEFGAPGSRRFGAPLADLLE
jgi:aminopeptidase N